MAVCINCGKSSIVVLCRKCRKKIPSGFSRHVAPDDLLSEIKRNEKLKNIFQSDITFGKLQVDTINKLFHIDNGYYRIADLSKYSFYSSEPRFSYGFYRRNVWEDIYFAFTLRDGAGLNQERRVRRIKTVSCAYTNTGNYISVEPSVAMLNMKQLFTQMIEDERNRLKSNLALNLSELISV